jgi:hypothetical protein
MDAPACLPSSGDWFLVTTVEDEPYQQIVHTIDFGSVRQVTFPFSWRNRSLSRCVLIDS